MFPIKNKKKPLEVTIDEMRNFSFSYVEKYAPSRQQLKTYLLKNVPKKVLHNFDQIKDLLTHLILSIN